MSNKEAERWSRAMFGRHLADLRRQRGLPQKDLAQVSGYTGVQVSHIESGRRRASTAYLDSVAGPLGIAVERLVRMQDTYDVGWVFAAPGRIDTEVLRTLIGPLVEKGKEKPAPAPAKEDDDLSRVQWTYRLWTGGSLPSTKWPDSPLHHLGQEAATLTPREIDKVIAFIAGLKAAQQP